MNGAIAKKESEHLQGLLLAEYQEATSDLRAHEQLIWTVISIFYATEGIIYRGYSDAIDSPSIYLAIGAAILGYGITTMTTILLLAERRRWSTEIQRRNQIKSALLGIPSSRAGPRQHDRWSSQARELLSKSLDDFFNEIDEKGKEAMKIFSGYRIERKSVLFFQLAFHVLLIAVWSLLICHAVVRHFAFESCSVQYALVHLVCTVVLTLLGIILVRLMIRKQSSR
jgi:hypothetical protein